MERPQADFLCMDEVINRLVILQKNEYSSEKLKQNLLSQKDKIGGYLQIKKEDGHYIDAFSDTKIQVFLDTHIRKSEALEYLQIQAQSLKAGIKKYGLIEIKIGRKLENMFMLRSEVEHYKENITSKNKEVIRKNTSNAMKQLMSVDGFYHSVQVCEMLKLSQKAFKNCVGDDTLLISDYGINQMPLFTIEHIEEIVAYQKELYENLSDNYYTASQATELLGGVIQYKTRVRLTKIDIPPLLKGLFNRHDNRIMYLKEDVDREVRELEIVRSKKDITSDNPIGDFYFQVRSLYKLAFNEKVINTSTYWFQFAEQKIYHLERNDEGVRSVITNLVRCTELLSKKLDKEIYNYSSNELNLLFLNHHVPLTYRTTIYLFLKLIYENFTELSVPTFSFGKLLNPYRNTKNHSLEVEELVYSRDDFLELIEYCSKADFHKKKAIKDVESLLDTLQYTNYDSAWLYVMTHLNNGWRHNTVVEQLPRIDISNLRADGLDWFKENDLTLEEAKDIVYQVGRKVINISKNKSEGNFFISDKLLQSFATAMCINEIRTRMTNNDSSTLIEFNTEYQRFTDRVHKVFFDDFSIPNFKFSSRKMNRTYLTLIHKILESSYEPLKASKFARSHRSIESTNIYIKFSREQLDELTEQLFARDTFGFIDKIFTDILFEKENNRQSETEMMVALNHSIGDKFKVEATSGFINHILTQRQEVERMIKAMSFEEIISTYRLLLMNQMPSKQKEYQCLFSSENCRKPDLAKCDNCPFSIPNVYAITNLLQRYISQIIRLNNEFDNMTIGQKKKMANHFYLTRLQLKEAEDKFGEDIVYGFVEGGRKAIQDLAITGNQLGKVKEYLTI